MGELLNTLKKKKIIISKKPMLKLLFEKDTLFMHAKQFVSQQKPGEKKNTSLP